MPKWILDPRLLQKLADKRRKSVQYIREQISKNSSRRGVSPQAYFVYLLIGNNIPSGLYQRRLLEETRQQVRELQAGLTTKNTSTPIRSRTHHGERLLKLKNLTVAAKAPILPADLLTHASENAEMYQVLYLFENTVRNIVSTVLARKHSTNWWSKKGVISKEIAEKVKERMTDEKINAFHGRRGPHEISYTDFSELALIINRNAADFSRLFAGVKGKVYFLTRRLDELAMTRNAIAHTSPLRRQDRDRLLLYFRDLFDQLDNLNTRI